MDEMLERAIFIAAAAHNGQVDKAGAPYILHLMRVSQALRWPADRIVGVLHDLLEDCPDWSAYRLRTEGFSARVVEAVETLTRREEEAYDAFIRRVAENPIAWRVKLADLADNSDLSRLPNPAPRDRLRAEKYARAIAYLRAASGDVGSANPEEAR